MTSPLNDPRFPDRPTHPHFWKLSAAANKHDGEVAEGGRPVEDVIADVIDPDSLLYMLQQRCMMLLRANGLPEQLYPLFQGIAVDAFLLGHAFGQPL